MRLQSLHRAYLSLHPLGVVHWVPEQLNIKAVTGACKLIDSCSLALCLATGSVVSSGICHRNKVNSHKIVSFTLHYITSCHCRSSLFSLTSNSVMCFESQKL